MRGARMLVPLPMPMPLVAFAMVLSASVLVCVCGSVAVAFGKNEMPRAPHCLGGGVAARLRHSAVDEDRSAARRGAGATSTAIK